MPNRSADIYLSVVIPAFDEEKNIAGTLHSLADYFAGKSYAVEFLVVDDGSADSTADFAETAGATVIRLEQNLGKGGAVRRGMLDAKGRFILFTDADYPYDISAIEDCFKLLEENSDVVIGSRNLPGSDRGRERVKRRVISRVGNMVAQILILPGISDTQAGFKCFRREAAKRIFSLTRINGWGFDIEILYIARMLRLKVTETPVRLIPRMIKPSRLQSPTRTAINVFGSIFRVHMNCIMGKYREVKPE